MRIVGVDVVGYGLLALQRLIELAIILVDVSVEIVALFAPVDIYFFWLGPLDIPGAQVLLLVLPWLFLPAQVILVPLLPVVGFDLRELDGRTSGLRAPGNLAGRDHNLTPGVPRGGGCVGVVDEGLPRAVRLSRKVVLLLLMVNHRWIRPPPCLVFPGYLLVRGLVLYRGSRPGGLR